MCDLAAKVSPNGSTTATSRADYGKGPWRPRGQREQRGGKSMHFWLDGGGATAPGHAGGRRRRPSPALPDWDGGATSEGRLLQIAPRGGAAHAGPGGQQQPARAAGRGSAWMRRWWAACGGTPTHRKRRSGRVELQLLTFFQERGSHLKALWVRRLMFPLRGPTFNDSFRINRRVRNWRKNHNFARHAMTHGAWELSRLGW
jgi:hypothetical protein